MEPPQQPTANSPPPSPTVPPSEPEIERQITNEALSKPDSENYVTVIAIQAIETMLEEISLSIGSEGFIVDSDGEYVEPYTYDPELFTDYDGVSDQHFIDYFAPVNEVRWHIGNRDRLHITELHSFVQGSEETDHQHPVPDDTITISEYNANTGCVMPIVTAWSSLWRNVWEEHPDAYGTENFIVTEPLVGDPPTLSCLRCGFTDASTEWDTQPRSDEQELGYGDVHICPECECQWDTNSISVCGECEAESSSEELEYVGEGVHVEGRCPDCGHGPIHDRITRYVD